MGGLTAVLAAPLVVAVVVLAEPRWYPLLDLAWTELRVRDVLTGDPPLIGLAGRIGRSGGGSHPGPLSFWSLWPFYRVFGASSWALQAGAVSLHVLALAATLWMACRRGGIRLALGVAAALAVLLHAYGPALLTEAWNPYLPMLWWVVFVLVAWSLTCGDVAVLPLGVFAGSFCVQTHVSYVGMVAGVGSFAVLALAMWTWRRRQETAVRRRVLVWSLAACFLGVVLWLPPVMEELTSSPGNLTVLWRYFSDPPEASIGLRRGAELLLANLNPWRLAVTNIVSPTYAGSSLLPGSVLVAAWAAAALAAWRLSHRVLLGLHAVLAVSMVVSVVTMSRIFGFVWYYLSLYTWGIAALMLVAVGWTMAALASSRLEGALRRKATVAGVVALAGVTCLWTGLLAVDAAHVAVPEPELAANLGELAEPTVAALGDDSVPGRGKDGRYLVSWVDPLHLGSQGYGLLLELERQGFDVGTSEANRAGATRHRVLDPARATARVHLATGADIERWRASPGTEEIVYIDPRTPEERSEYLRMREEVISGLREAGLPDLVKGVDENIFVTSLDPRVPPLVHLVMTLMQDLGLPTAVFVGPPDADR